MNRFLICLIFFVVPFVGNVSAENSKGKDTCQKSNLTYYRDNSKLDMFEIQVNVYEYLYFMEFNLGLAEQIFFKNKPEDCSIDIVTRDGDLFRVNKLVIEQPLELIEKMEKVGDHIEKKVLPILSETNPRFPRWEEVIRKIVELGRTEADFLKHVYTNPVTSTQLKSRFSEMSKLREDLTEIVHNLVARDRLNH